MPTKRILISAILYGAGGTETHLLNLFHLLVRAGAEVTVVARYANPETPVVQLHKSIPVCLITTLFARSLGQLRFSTAWAMAILDRGLSVRTRLFVLRIGMGSLLVGWQQLRFRGGAMRRLQEDPKRAIEQFARLSDPPCDHQ